jgi:hypothetical protein
MENIRENRRRLSPCLVGISRRRFTLSLYPLYIARRRRIGNGSAKDRQPRCRGPRRPPEGGRLSTGPLWWNGAGRARKKGARSSQASMRFFGQCSSQARWAVCTSLMLEESRRGSQHWHPSGINTTDQSVYHLQTRSRLRLPPACQDVFTCTTYTRAVCRSRRCGGQRQACRV